MKTVGPKRADAVPAGAAAPVAPVPRLQFTQVAFAGHNRDSDLGDPKSVTAGLKVAFRKLTEGGLSQGRLLTGYAPGADQAAVRAWRDAALGSVHVVFPFLGEQAGGHPPPDIQSATWLDGATTRANGRNPHLAQTRWLIGAADLLVVVWTGQQARKAGGTADAVRLALEHRVPILWVQPAHPDHPRLIRPQFLDEDFGFLEFLDELHADRAPLVTHATPEGLHAALSVLGLSAADTVPEEFGPDAPHRIGWSSRTYAVFRRTLGGRGSGFADRPPPEDLGVQKGFVALTRARRAAAEHARRLGAVHRSHQVILLGIAILAAAAGSASALLPNLKLLLVALELVLALVALAVWLGAEREERHHQWGRARKLAEDLRLERAAWTLGASTVPHGLGRGSGPQAREARRLAGLPSGAYDPDRVTAWGAWAIDQLLSGQIAYHRDQTTINGRISHRVHQFENASFGLLLVILLGYVVASVIYALGGGAMPHWVAGVVFMAGSIVPAIGAAGLALEATLDLGDQAQRSRVLADELNVLRDAVDNPPTLESLQAVAKAAFRLERAQEDHWMQDAARRRLFRGG
jgi:hypothetical protein